MSPVAETTINGRAYRLVRLPPLQAGRIATRVAQALAGALSDAELVAPLMQAFKNAKPDATAEGETDDKTGRVQAQIRGMFAEAPKLLAALAGGIRKLDADALYSAAEECVKDNVFASEKLTAEAFNRHFSEHPADLLPVMAWALRENCAGFFGLGAQASK